MQAILFCDKTATCIPMQDCPEALLPVCNEPLLARLLRYLEKSGFESAALLAADDRIRRLLDTLNLQMPVRFARSLASLRADTPTLVLRRLCIPDWEMGELYALSGREAVRLFHPDGTPACAELHPTGSALLEPAAQAVLSQSQFRMPDNPGSYRTIQQKLLAAGEKHRIGAGVRVGRDAQIDTQSILGADCVIGPGARIEDSVLGDGVQVGAGAVLRHCVVCRHALVDRGAVLENGTVPEGAILPAEAGMPRSRRLLALPEDGICWQEPRWNTPETALRAGAAMSTLSERIAVGYSQPAGESLALAAAAGAVSQGIAVWQAGQCALSQLIFIARQTRCGAMLWVGGDVLLRLLPFGQDGQSLNAAQAARLQQALDAELSSRIVEEGRLSDGSGLLPLWEEQCRALLPAHLPEIRVSCADPALRQAAERLFSGGSGEQITLTLTEDGTGACAFSLETGMLGREQLLLLAALSVKELGEGLAVPADFHPAAEQFAMRFGVRLLRLHPGAVTAASLAARQGICTDGVRLFAHVLRVLDSRKLTLRQAAALLPELCTVKRTVVTALPRQAVEHLRRRDPSPDVQITMPPQSRLVRVQAHAATMEAAAELCALWEKKLIAAEKADPGR